MRKSPVRHIVSSYQKEDGTLVSQHLKGSGTKPVVRKSDDIPRYLEDITITKTPSAMPPLNIGKRLNELSEQKTALQKQLLLMRSQGNYQGRIVDQRTKARLQLNEVNKEIKSLTDYWRKNPDPLMNDTLIAPGLSIVNPPVHVIIGNVLPLVRPPIHVEYQPISRLKSITQPRIPKVSIEPPIGPKPRIMIEPPIGPKPRIMIEPPIGPKPLPMFGTIKFQKRQIN